MTELRAFGPAQLSSEPTVLFTAGAGGITIRRVRITNPPSSAGPATYTLSIGVDGAGNRLCDSLSVAQGGQSILTGPFTLEEGEYLTGYASVADRLDASINGTGTESQMVLAVHSGGTYFVNGEGTPVRLKTDADWILSCNFSLEDQKECIDGLVTLGFNAITLMNIVRSSLSWGTNAFGPPRNFYDEPPFTGADFLTPNPDYFETVSELIDYCLSKGVYVCFFHTYYGAGGGGDGWAAPLAAITDQQAFDWGVYLGTTFWQPNIIWMHAGDDNMGGTARTRFQQVVAGIRSVTRNRLAGAEGSGPDSIITDVTGLGTGKNPTTSDMQVSAFYGQGQNQDRRSFVAADKSYLLSTAGTCGPAYQTEPNYIDAFYDPQNSRSDIRSMISWALTSGALGGTNFGEAQRWDGRSGMLASLNDPSTLDMSRINGLFDSLSWWRMRPSGINGTPGTSPAQGGSVNCAGYCGRILIASRSGGANSNDTSFIAAMMTDNGEEFIGYVPPTGTGTTTFTVDLRSMAGTTNFKWWNPTTGIETNIGDFPNSASGQSFTTPGNNGTGVNDWFLVGRRV